jgi:phosphatidylinositol 4-kinase
LLGGRESETFGYFKILLAQGFMELRKYVDSIIYLLEIMMEESDLPCFQEFDIKVFRSRFFEKSTDKEVDFF